MNEFLWYCWGCLLMAFFCFAIAKGIERTWERENQIAYGVEGLVIGSGITWAFVALAFFIRAVLAL